MNDANSQTRTSVTTNAIVPCNINKLCLTGNLSENWRLWFQKFKIYLVASGLDVASDERKIALLLHNLGEKCIEIFNSFNLSSEDSKKYDVVINKFETHFSPKKNLTVLRHKFLNRKQGPSETIDSFYTDLINLSLVCEFKEIRESLVCDVLLSGLNSSNQHVKERLFREAELNLEKA
jgi:hypothetical protein